MKEHVCICMYMDAFLITALCTPCSHLAKICSFFFSFSFLHPSLISKIPDIKITSCNLAAGC